MLKIFQTCIFLLAVPFFGHGQQDTVLMFVSHDSTYYSEYIVMKQALEVSGYVVDVRNASGEATSIYMIPNGTTISATANTLSGSSYTEFTNQFLGLFSTGWNASLDPTPSSINVDGRIQDVVDMSAYVGLIVVGGQGAIAYRVDGLYSSQGSGIRFLPAADVQAAAEKLNLLALEALQNGKPVMAQCHGASIPAFWRVPGTTGPGQEALGYSLLKGQYATGFPETATPTTLSSLDITHRTNDRVTISSPYDGFMDDENGNYKMITTRDWYPQTVAHAARSFVNILETYPVQEEMTVPVNVLILHGGALDSLNCSPANRLNDVPCNYGAGSNLPADYTDVYDLLVANSANDDFDFDVSAQNITSESLPYDPGDQASIESYFSSFDVLIFFKHWSTGITDELQNALVSYADNGGGVLALHHGLYNDLDGALDKNIITSQLFGAQSHETTWSASLTNYDIYQTNYGHFVSTYGIEHTLDAAMEPGSWASNPLSAVANTAFSYYPRFAIYDEIYNNMEFTSGQIFGRGVNQITPLFSNNQYPDGQTHTTGFVKRFNPSLNATEGRVAFFEAGERRESINILHQYGQVIRNAVVWLGNKQANTGLSLSVEDENNPLEHSGSIRVYPNPVENVLHLDCRRDTIEYYGLYDFQGKLILENEVRAKVIDLNLEGLSPGLYLIQYVTSNRKYTERFIKK